MNINWQSELDSYLSQTETDIRAYLGPIKRSLQENGIPFNEKFKKHFLQIISNRLSEIFDRFEIQSSQQQPNKQNDTSRSSSSVDRKRQRDKSFDRESSMDSKWSYDENSKEMFELRQQNRFMNNIIVYGIPQMNARENREDLMEIFLRLCRRLNVDVSRCDIIDVSRFKKNQILVKFHSYHIKDKVRIASRSKPTNLSNLMKLPSNIQSSDIFVNHQTTKFYLEMDVMGRKAVADGKIYEYNITANGFMVKRTKDSHERIILSLRELKDYIYRATSAKRPRK